MPILANCTLKNIDGQRECFEKQGLEIEDCSEELEFISEDPEKINGFFEKKVRHISDTYDGILLGGNILLAIMLYLKATKYNLPCYVVEENKKLIQVPVKTCLSGDFLPLDLEFDGNELCPKCGNQIGVNFRGGRVKKKKV